MDRKPIIDIARLQGQTRKNPQLCVRAPAGQEVTAPLDFTAPSTWVLTFKMINKSGPPAGAL